MHYRPQGAVSCSALQERVLGSPHSTSQVSLQYDNFIHGICIAPCHPDRSPQRSRKLPTTQPSRQGVANNNASISACVNDPSGGSASQGLSKAKEDGSKPSLSRRHGHPSSSLVGFMRDRHCPGFGVRESAVVGPKPA